MSTLEVKYQSVNKLSLKFTQKSKQMFGRHFCLIILLEKTLIQKHETILILNLSKELEFMKKNPF